jgi:hypothetical protein
MLLKPSGYQLKPEVSMKSVLFWNKYFVVLIIFSTQIAFAQKIKEPDTETISFKCESVPLEKCCENIMIIGTLNKKTTQHAPNFIRHWTGNFHVHFENSQDQKPIGVYDQDFENITFSDQSSQNYMDSFKGLIDLSLDYNLSFGQRAMDNRLKDLEREEKASRSNPDFSGDGMETFDKLWPNIIQIIMNRKGGPAFQDTDPRHIPSESRFLFQLINTKNDELSGIGYRSMSCQLVAP